MIYLTELTETGDWALMNSDTEQAIRLTREEATVVGAILAEKLPVEVF